MGARRTELASLAHWEILFKEAEVDEYRTTPDPAIENSQMTLEALRSADVIVVGTGFYGLTIAERVATQTGRRVHMLERRGHRRQRLQPQRCRHRHRGAPTARTCSTPATSGWWTTSRTSRRSTTISTGCIRATRGKIYPMPINLGTITTYFEQAMSPDQARALVAEQAAELGTTEPANLEEKAISLIGRPLYEAFIRGTPPSSGRPIRANSTRASSPDFPCATPSTIGTSMTPSRACRSTGTRPGCPGWPTIR